MSTTELPCWVQFPDTPREAPDTRCVTRQAPSMLDAVIYDVSQFIMANADSVQPEVLLTVRDCGEPQKWITRIYIKPQMLTLFLWTQTTSLPGFSSSILSRWLDCLSICFCTNLVMQCGRSLIDTYILTYVAINFVVFCY